MGELTALPQAPSWIKGVDCGALGRGGEGKGEKEKGRGKEGEAKRRKGFCLG